MSKNTSNTGGTLALIGAGNMGGAMLSGWLADGLDPAGVTVIDPSPPPAMAALLEKHSIVTRATCEGVAPPDVLIVAVKPQIFDKVLEANKALAGAATVTVSVAAGKTLELMERIAGTGRAIVRAMPNTPALVARGITVCCANAAVSPEQKNRVDRLLQAVGKVEWVEVEALIDAVTAVSGSGPAYVFHLAECMAAAGMREGLSEELAMKLARETVSGAGELMRQSELSAARLRENVTSPNGTTAAALAILMGESGLQDLMERAIAAARKRSQELS
ncbi:MAG: pyrroline-5-carboxylate reductase [Rhizobiaceae bacterium]